MAKRKQPMTQKKTIDQIFHDDVGALTDADLNRDITHAQAAYLLKLSRQRVGQLIREGIIREPVTTRSAIDDYVIDYLRAGLDRAV